MLAEKKASGKQKDEAAKDVLSSHTMYTILPSDQDPPRTERWRLVESKSTIILDSSSCSLIMSCDCGMPLNCPCSARVHLAIAFMSISDVESRNTTVCRISGETYATKPCLYQRMGF